MIKKIRKIYSLLKSIPKIGFKNFIINKNKIRLSTSSMIDIGSSVQIKNSNIYIHENSKLKIEEGVTIANANISVKGSLFIGRDTFINKGYLYRNLSINIEGDLSIGQRNRIQSDFLIRYNGKVTIGNANNINPESEIRCDELIKIGNYNQISYKVMIWDTNTHNIYTAKKRRELTDVHYPVFGYEFEKPETKPVIIGDDCWLSKEVSILKGTELKDKCIVGLKTMILNKTIKVASTVVSNNELKIFNNKL